MKKFLVDNHFASSQTKEETQNKSSNRVITDEMNKSADDILKANLGTLGGNPLVNAQLYKALAIKGAYHFENGLTNISKWSKKMIEEYGEKIRPVLIDIWRDIQKNEKLKQTELASSLDKNTETIKSNNAVISESKLPKKDLDSSINNNSHKNPFPHLTLKNFIKEKTQLVKSLSFNDWLEYLWKHILQIIIIILLIILVANQCDSFRNNSSRNSQRSTRR